MDQLYSWLGDLNQIEGLRREAIGLICLLASAICGAIIGMEREKRDKPAGLRTLVLIALGSTIFTLVSMLLAAQKAVADPARLAAQIVPGIGFLGAGAIIRGRGSVSGLTTAATIWAVAAVGVTIGTGFVAAGFIFTFMILFTLTLLNRLERRISGSCRFRRATVVYRPDHGKTRPRLQEILDRYRVHDDSVVCEERTAEEHVLLARLCLYHRDHRGVLKDLAEVAEVRALELDEG